MNSTKTRVNPANLDRIGFFDETGFEKETSIVSTITATALDLIGGVTEAVSDLKQTVTVTETNANQRGNDKFSMDGSITEFNKAKAQLEEEKQQRKTADIQRIFFQTLKEDTQKVQLEKEKVFEEEVNDIIANLPTEQKNELLHYQASYKDKSVYQRAELRKKLIEQQEKSEKQEKATSIPTPAKQPSALEGAFAGRSGSQGGGSANLSNQAVG